MNGWCWGLPCHDISFWALLFQPALFLLLQAVQMVKAGLKAIYLSGWQVAADANSAAQTYPDQSLYPVDSVPRVVKRINNVSGVLATGLCVHACLSRCRTHCNQQGSCAVAWLAKKEHHPCSDLVLARHIRSEPNISKPQPETMIDTRLFICSSLSERSTAALRFFFLQALRRADQIEHAEGKVTRDYLVPIVADAEAGFGGPLNAYELTYHLIEAGAAAGTLLYCRQGLGLGLDSPEYP